jgi:hypothetical protein
VGLVVQIVVGIEAAFSTTAWWHDEGVMSMLARILIDTR